MILLIPIIEISLFATIVVSYFTTEYLIIDCEENILRNPIIRKNVKKDTINYVIY